MKNQQRNETTIPLELCTEEHFEGLKSEFENLELTDSLCPPKNYSYEIKGKFGDDVFG